MAEKILDVRMKQRYDTEANWKASDPILLSGEVAYSSNKNNRYKVGDGKSKWSALSYSKADPTSHTHTKSQITDFPTSLKNPYALTIQGNGTTLTNGTYDGSAAKTVNITPASIGAASSSHGTHVSYNTTAPLMDGTASVGTASTVARSDHRHPTDTSRAPLEHTHTLLVPIALTTENLNDLIPNETTFYYASGGNSILNNPFGTGTGFGMYVYRSASGYRTQEIISGDTKKTRFWNGTSWSTWLPIARFTLDPASGQVLVTDGTNGGIKSSGYTIAKSVPSNAVFTDTKNTAGSTDSSSKLFLIGATSQSTSTQTYSHDTAYIGTDGCLYSASKKVSVDGHTHNYAGSNSAGGAAKSATTVYSTSTNPTAGTWYYLPFHADASSNNKSLLCNDGISYYSVQGTVSELGHSYIRLGNSIASGTAGNKQGRIRLYSSSSGYTDIVNTASENNYTITFPSKTGTVALTSSNVASASKLATARTINGTAFDGSGNITTSNWGTTRTITIGNTGKSVNGSSNYTWTLAEIGAAEASHTHDYIPTSASCNKNWNWEEQSGQPTWVWGGNDGTNMYVYNPSRFSVSNAGLLRQLSIRPTSANITVTGSGGLATFKATSSMTTGKPPADSHVLHFYWDNTGGWDAQLAVRANNPTNVYVRGMDSGTWGDWQTLLSSANYNSYALPLSGGTMTGTITSSLTTNTHLNGNKGVAIINSTAGGSGYNMLAKMNSTNGVYCLGYYTGAMHLYYTANSTIDAGTNAITKDLILMNESGNSTFPGQVNVNGIFQHNGKNVLTGNDSWLRINDGSPSPFSSGVYFGSSKVRTDNHFTVNDRSTLSDSGLTLGQHQVDAYIYLGKTQPLIYTDGNGYDVKFRYKTTANASTAWSYTTISKIISNINEVANLMTSKEQEIKIWIANSYLPLSGGTMIGKVSMGAHNIGFAKGNGIISDTTGNSLIRQIDATNYTNLTSVGNNSNPVSIYTSTNVWKNGSSTTYFQTTSASDKRLKEHVGDMSEYEKFFSGLKPIAFKYHDGLYNAPGKPTLIQWGLYAQDVIKAFNESGIDWHEQELVVIEDGDLTEEELKYVQPGTLLKMNYQNLTALNIHMIQKHTVAITEMESQINSLKNQLTQLQTENAHLSTELAQLKQI